MDGDLFEAWLDGIRWLTAEQRVQGLRALALAEVSDVSLKTAAPGAQAGFAATPIAGSMSGTRNGTVARIEAVAASEVPVAVRREAVSLETAAQPRWISRVALIAVAKASSDGGMPAGCPATGAAIVGAASTR
jgi:hypothetical protein